jgi:hypothetical protein
MQIKKIFFYLIFLSLSCRAEDICTASPKDLLDKTITNKSFTDFIPQEKKFKLSQFPDLIVRFEMNANHLATFPCEKCDKIKSRGAARAMISEIFYGTSVIPIPGYSTIEEFYKDHAELISNFLFYINANNLDPYIQGDTGQEYVVPQSDSMKYLLERILHTVRYEKTPYFLRLYKREGFSNISSGMLVQSIERTTKGYKLIAKHWLNSKIEKISISTNDGDVAFSINNQNYSPLSVWQEVPKELLRLAFMEEAINHYCKTDKNAYSSEKTRWRKITGDWGFEQESSVRTLMLYTPRLIQSAAKSLFWGKFAQRSIRVGTSLSDLVTSLAAQQARKFELASYRFSDSLVNLPATAADAISDLATAIKAPYYATKRPTTRIKVCAGNLIAAMTRSLTPLHFVSPASHVAANVDDDWFTYDPAGGPYEFRGHLEYGGLYCTNSYLEDDQPEQIAVERLACAQEYYDAPYGFLSYNCAAYTRDILNISGLAYPDFSNLGIGNYIPVTKLPFDRGDTSTLNIQNKLRSTKSFCNDFVSTLRRVIFSINADGTYKEEDLLALKYKYGKISHKYRRDFLLKLQSQIADPARRKKFVDTVNYF